MPSSARLERLSPHLFWMIRDLVTEACAGDRTGHDATMVLEAAARDEMQLWRVEDGKTLAAVVTQIRRRPIGNVCDILICTGRERERWQHLVAGIEDWARAEGCVAMDVSARPGWKRILKDYEMTHVQLFKDLCHVVR